MKKIFLALALAVSGTAAADSVPSIDKDVIAQYAVNLDIWSIDQDEQGMTWGIVKVKRDGALTVDKWLYNWGNAFTPEFKGSVQINLVPAAAQTIRQNIISISNAKTKTTYSDVVCMMMPAPGPNSALFIRSGYDYRSDSFKGRIRIVESNTGCWAHSHTSLENEYDRQVAASLEAQLQILAIQFSK